MIKIQGIDPDMIANNLTPAYPTHPGEVVKDEIEYRKISQRKLAEQTGIPYKVLNDILNGRRSMTTATAMMLEAALGVPADSLMRLQLKYNMQQATRDKSFMERLAQIRKYATHRKFPVPPLSPSWRRAGRLFSSLPRIKDIKTNMFFVQIVNDIRQIIDTGRSVPNTARS